MKPQGPNLRKFICHKMSLLLVPPGGGLASALTAMATPGRLLAASREATAWGEAAIAAVKSTPNNPYGDDDEAIAGEILRQVAAKKAADAAQKR